MAARFGYNVKIPIPEGLNPEEREALGEDVVRFIRDRTQDDNVDKNNRRFAKYSKSYIKSLDFKLARKSPSKVDLTLTGDMLASMELLRASPGELTIGFRSNDLESKKAQGHCTGDIGVKRDFLGITKKDLDILIKQLKEKQ